jgi:hypothetical protein
MTPTTSTLLPVTSGVLALDRPPSKLRLLYGPSAVFPLSMRIAAYAVHRGRPVAVVDGCNRFDVHTVAHYARRQRLDVDRFLNRIFVSRGFTCYQMEAAIIDRLRPFLHSINAQTAMVFGLLDTLYDEQAPLHDVQRILRNVLDALRAMRSDGISVLVTCNRVNVQPAERNHLFATLRAHVDDAFQLVEDAEHGQQLLHETPRVATLPPH